MRIRIVEDECMEDDEIVIHCKKVTPKIQKILDEYDTMRIKAIHRGREIFLDLNEVLFFETEADDVYAHLKSQAYKTSYRLYELESLLPGYYVRISKSTITNSKNIASLERNLTSSRAIMYHDSHKVSYVSRMYYSLLKHKLEERSLV